VLNVDASPAAMILRPPAKIRLPRALM